MAGAVTARPQKNSITRIPSPPNHFSVMWPFSKPYPTTKVSNIDGHAYDYIIVGGGTGGCALAACLSADLGKTVLLLDRGDAIISWLSRVPLLTMDHRQSTAPSYKWTSLPRHCETALPST
jgi:choline dehydrogenase